MPYDPGIQYHGDQYIAAGISKLGDVFSGALDRYAELRKQANLNDTIVAHAHDKGLINQDEYNKYVQSSWGQKQGIANGIMANMHDDFQRQQFDAEEKDKELQRALSLKIAEIAHSGDAGVAAATAHQIDVNSLPGKGWGPGEPFAEAAKAGGTMVETQKGVYQFQPYGGPDAATNVVTQPLKIGDREVPGKAVVTKGGSNAFQIVDTLQTPPGSVMSGPGIPANTFVTGAKGNPIKLDKATTRRLNNDAAGPQPTPSPSYWQRFAPSILGGAPAATPQPDPTVAPQPDPTPGQTPVPSVVAPAPAAAGGTPDASGFIVGKKYKDAQGNTATYAGNGQWR